jgi:hypothetical protein
VSHFNPFFDRLSNIFFHLNRVLAVLVRGNKQKGDNEGGLLKTLPSQQSRV